MFNIKQTNKKKKKSSPRATIAHLSSYTYIHILNYNFSWKMDYFTFFLFKTQSVFVLLKFIRPKAGTYKRKIWNYQRADFGKFRQILSEQDLVSQVRQNDLDTSVQLWPMLFLMQLNIRFQIE